MHHRKYLSAYNYAEAWEVEIWGCGSGVNAVVVSHYVPGLELDWQRKSVSRVAHSFFAENGKTGDFRLHDQRFDRWWIWDYWLCGNIRPKTAS